jgi:uncharacterized protein involved in exopolysaccharide biosynthesis
LIAARLVEIYREEYVRVHRTAGSYQFFADQTLLTQGQWEAASAELGTAKNKLGIVTIEGRKKQLQDEITDVDAKLLANRSDLSTARARIASLQELVAQLPATVITQQAQAPNAAFDNMRGTVPGAGRQVLDAPRHDQLVHRKAEPGRADQLRLGRDESLGGVHLLVEHRLGAGAGQILIPFGTARREARSDENSVG